MARQIPIPSPQAALSPEASSSDNLREALARQARSPLDAWAQPRHDPSLEHGEQGRLLGAISTGQIIGLGALVASAETAVASTPASASAANNLSASSTEASPAVSLAPETESVAGLAPAELSHATAAPETDAGETGPLPGSALNSGSGFGPLPVAAANGRGPLSSSAAQGGTNAVGPAALGNRDAAASATNLLAQDRTPGPDTAAQGAVSQVAVAQIAVTGMGSGRTASATPNPSSPSISAEPGLPTGGSPPLAGGSVATSPLPPTEPAAPTGSLSPIPVPPVGNPSPPDMPPTDGPTTTTILITVPPATVPPITTPPVDGPPSTPTNPPVTVPPMGGSEPTVPAVPASPHLTIGIAAGLEDHAIALNLALAPLEAGSMAAITVSGLPAGAVLSAGIAQPDGGWSLTSQQLPGLTLTPPHDSDAPFTLGVTASAQEANGQVASISGLLPVSVLGVADVPSVSAAAALGVQNAAVPLSIGGALADTDGSETLSFVVRGLPTGFALNHGIDNGDHSWTLTPGETSGLTLTTPYNFEGHLALTVTAVSHEDQGGGMAASAPLAFGVGIGDVAHGISIDLAAGLDPTNGLSAGVHLQTNLLDDAGLVIPEDAGRIALPDAALLAGLHVGVSQYLFEGLPQGTSITGGVDLGHGVWQVAPAQLSHLELVTAPDSDQDFTLTVRGQLPAGLGVIDLQAIPVHVAGVADTPNLSLDAATGLEGHPVALGIHGALTDTDGSEQLSYHIHDLPAGFTLSAGIQNEDHGWSLTSAQLAGLTVQPSDHWNGDANLTVSVVSTEREGDWTHTEAVLHLHVDPVAAAPVIAPVEVQGIQSQAVTLYLGISSADTSDHLNGVTLGALPDGATLSYGTDQHDGSWNLDLAHLSDTQLIAPAGWSGEGNLTITASAADSTAVPVTVSAILPVHVEAVAEAPVLSTSDASGVAGTPIALQLGATVHASDPLSVIVPQPLPLDMTLSSGLSDGQGSWVVHTDPLSSLTVTASASSPAEDAHLTLWAQATPAATPATPTNTASHDFTVHVASDPLGLAHLIALGH